MNTTTTNATIQPETADAGRKATIGVVESDKRDKTRKVVVRFMVKHPKYGKFVRRRTVLHVHDEANESKAGDTVEVAPCRPISRTKTWRLVRVVGRGLGADPLLAENAGGRAA